MPDIADMKLGKPLASAAPPDPRNLKLADYLDLAALPDPIPDSIDYTDGLTFPMFGNDTIGDCVPAAMAHQEQADSALTGREVTITDTDVIAAYSAIGGYVPGNPATDQGCDPQVALKYWQQTGIAGNKIGAYVSVDPTNDTLVKAALYLFGGLFIGIDLPKSAQSQSSTAGVWDVVGDGKTGDSEPGSWGGHMICGLKRLPGNAPYGVVTWGYVQAMTPAFLATYSFQQVFAVIPTAWLNGQQQAPNGLKLAELQRDLAIVSGQPDPGPPPQPTPAPFVPDPGLVAWLTWQVQAAQYVAAQYAAGQAAAAESEQAVLTSYAAWLGQYITSVSPSHTALPALPSLATLPARRV